MSFKNFEKKLKKARKAVNKLGDHQSISFTELFNPKFMCKHSQFKSFDELASDGKFNINTTEDFAAIPDEEWNKYILNNTLFCSWNAMLQKAGEEFMANTLGL